MDLLQLKQLPATHLPVVNAVTNLLAISSALPQLQSRVIREIGDNLSQFSRDFASDLPTIRRTTLSIFSTENVSNLISESLFLPWPSSKDHSFTELYDMTIPLSEAFSKFRLETKKYSEDYSVKLPFLASSNECSSNAICNVSIQRNIFNTALPLSFIRDFNPSVRNNHQARKSIPNRQPYETGKETKKGSESLGTLFQRFLKRTTRR